MANSKAIRIFINGFGRIGRSAARIILSDSRFTLVGVNDLYDFSQMAALLQYDSVYGRLDKSVMLRGDVLEVGESKIALFHEADPAKLPLNDVDVVLACCGVFLTEKSCLGFLDAGASKVVISTPSKDAMPTYIMGVNHDTYNGEVIISNSSCSANAIVPLATVLDEAFGIRSAMFSMYHSYTAYQRLVDSSHYSKDIRRTRSATQNIIPLQSSAAEATARFFPHLKEKLYAKSVRIPLAATTFYDLSFHIAENTTTQNLISTLEDASKKRLNGIVSLTSEAKVSGDFIADTHSAVVDTAFCEVLGKNLVRIGAWQDNEYGYASRLVEMAAVVSR